MKLDVRQEPTVDDIEVSIVCPYIDHRVKRIIDAAEMEDRRLAGCSDGFLCFVELDDVLYIESVDGNTFLYTANKVIESSMSLAKIEAELVGTEFIRATRGMIVNLAHVCGIRPYLNARLELVLDNDEHLIASRQFASAIKKRIGL